MPAVVPRGLEKFQPGYGPFEDRRAVSAVEIELIFVRQRRLMILGKENLGHLHAFRLQRICHDDGLGSERIGISGGYERRRKLRRHIRRNGHGLEALTEKKITMLPKSEPRITGAAPHHEFNNAPEDAARGITKPGTHMDMSTAVTTNRSRPTIKSFSNVAPRFRMMSSTRCKLSSLRPVPLRRSRVSELRRNERAVRPVVSP